MVKLLEAARKETAEIQHKYDELSIENEHMSRELQSKGKIMEDMSTKIARRENEEQELKTKVSQ